LSAWVHERPSMALLVDYQRRLSETLERSGRNGTAMVEALQAWCADAERSGIAALEDFARRIKGYQLVQSALA